MTLYVLSEKKNHHDTMRIGLQKARTQLSRLVERALRGEEIILTRRGKAIARLVPIQHDEPEMRPVALHRRKLTSEEVTASLEGVDPETLQAFYH